MVLYDTILARSFSKHEQKKFGYWGFVACLFLALSFFTIFKPYLGPLPVLVINLRLSPGPAEVDLFHHTSSSSSSSSRSLVIKPKEITMNGTLFANDTSSSDQEIFRETLAKNSATNATILRSPQIIKEIVSKDTWIMFNNTNSSAPKSSSDADADVVTKKNKLEPPCNIMGRSDFCELKGDIRIDANSSTVFSVSSENHNIQLAADQSWSIRPYARKGDQVAMAAVREWTVKVHAPHIPRCTQNHSIPAILFSIGGYSGNHFHAFTDIIVPLFSTARPYSGQVQFLMTNTWSGWIVKFKTLLKSLSGYDIIDVDDATHYGTIHCFERITVGLKGRSQRELSIDSEMSPYSIKDFRQFLRSSYSLKKRAAIRMRDIGARPRLVIISRKRSRAFTNVGEIGKMAKRLGYRVAVREAGERDVSGFAEMMNSCDVVMGVHGAGLTNMVFLPENAVLIQVIPFGGAEWVSRTYFEEPAKDMNIRYLEYKIRVEESSLMEQYPAEHVVLRDPSAIGRQGWTAFKSIYLEKQNVTLDVHRFRPTLVKAFQLLRQ